MKGTWHTALTTGAFLLASGGAMAQEWSLTLRGAPNSGIETTDLKEAEPNLITSEEAKVTIRNDGAIAWDTLKVFLTVGGAPATELGVAGDGAERVISIRPDQVPAGAALAFGTQQGGTFGEFASFPLAVETARNISQPDLPSTAHLVTYPCGTLPISQPLYRGKSGGLPVLAKEKAEAQVYVTPLGVVLAGALDELDENDSLRVWVYGHPQLLPLLTVKRTSEFGVTGQIRIVGEEIEGVRGLIRERQAERQPVPCGLRDFLVRDFAPGRGVVQIVARLSAAEETQLGTFDFNVHPLYTGMFTLGGAWSNILDPDFRVVASGDGDEMIILPGQEGEDELHYALFYTAFIWGQRDLEKGVRPYHRLNPTFGLVLDDLSDNALIGITLDLPHGFALTWGYHFRRVTTLSRDSVLEPGDVFVPPEDGDFELPTAKEWQDDTFYAFSIDLRAFSKLLISAVGGGS